MSGLKIAGALLAVFFLIGPASAQDSAAEAGKTSCLGCHETEMVRPEWRTIPDEWRTSWHFRNNVSCHDCHGGDPVDAAMAMNPERGFAGAPDYAGVPEFCGKCHIGILKNYLESGHGRALKANGSGPNCVVCHGSHDTQKAGIGIISEKRCTQCHTYERAALMKQALSATEDRLRQVRGGLDSLRAAGVYTAEEEKSVFSTEASFRTLFHSVDVALIDRSTGDYLKKLDAIQARVDAMFRELAFRKKFSSFLMALFLAMAAVLGLLAREKK